MTIRLKVISAVGGLFLSSVTSSAMIDYIPNWATKDNAMLTLAVATPITAPIAADLSTTLMKSLSSKGMGIQMIKAMPVIVCLPLGLSDDIQFNKRKRQGDQKGSKWWYAVPGITAATLSLVQYYRSGDLFNFLVVGLVSSATLMLSGYGQAQKERRSEELQQARDQALEQNRLIQQMGQEYLHKAMVRQEKQLRLERELLQKETDYNNRLTQGWQPEVATENIGY